MPNTNTFDNLASKKKLLGEYGPGGTHANEGTAAKAGKTLDADELKRYPGETKGEYEARIRKAKGL